MLGVFRAFGKAPLGHLYFLFLNPSLVLEPFALSVDWERNFGKQENDEAKSQDLVQILVLR